MQNKPDKDLYLSQLQTQVKPAFGLDRLYEPGFISPKKELKDKKKQEDPSQLDLLESNPFQSLGYQNKAVGETLELFENFSDGVSSHNESSFDAFISGLAQVSANIVITGAIGYYASAALGACSEAKYLKEKFDELDSNNVSSPAANVLSVMQTGCTVQENFDNIGIILQAAEKLDQQKRKVIKSHEKKLMQFATLIREGIKNSSYDLHQSYYGGLTYPVYTQHQREKISNIPEFDLEKSHQEYWAQHERGLRRFQEEKKAAKQKPQKTTANKSSNSNSIAATDTTQAREERAKIFVEQQKKLDTLLKEFKSEMEYQEAMSTIAGGFNGVAAIASIFGNKKEAYAIATFATAGIQAVDSMRTIAQAGLTGAGIHPYVGILMSVASMVSLFQEDDAQDGTQAILDAIAHGIMHLSQQIHQFQEEVREQFAEVHKKLDKHHLIVLEKFFALHQDQENILQHLKDLHTYIADNHRAIQSGIDALHARVDTNFRMTLDNLNGFRIENIDKLRERSLLILKRTDVSPEEFSRCLDELYIEGTSGASADALTGGSVDIHSPAAIQTVLERSSSLHNIFEHPAFANINLLSRFLYHEKLVNPLIWIKCVDTIMQMLDQKLKPDEEYPPTENMKDLDIKKLLLLKKHGKKVRAFIKRVGQKKYLEHMAQTYEQGLQELSEAVQHVQTNFEEKETQLLRREHTAFFEAERSKTQRIASSYECKKCVEHVTYFTQPTNRYKILYQRSDPFWLYYREQKDPPHSRRAPPLLPECNEVHMLSTGEKKPTDVLNPTEKLKQICQEHTHFMEAQKDLLLRSIALDLTHNACNAIGNGRSQWLYPENDATTIPILLLPKQNLPLNSIYITAENKGKGTITHEYTTTGNVFHLQSYFTIKHNNQKVKILDMFKPYTSEQEYSSIENILHYWYGGRFAKAPDLFKIQRNNMTSWHFFPFPPITPYPAERDTFVSTAQRGPDQANQFLPLIQQLIEEDQQEKRLQFNQEIMTHMSCKSPTSEVYKAAQKVDVCFKILDALLTLMYHDLMSEDQRSDHPELFAITSDDDKHYLKNGTALTRYLQNYSSKINQEHKQGDYLPCYIRYTTDKLMHAVQEINNARYRPQFKAVTQVIDNINLLVRNYRDIRPREIAPKPTSEESKLLAIILRQNEEKDKKIDELMEHNRELAAETKALREEVAGVKEQLQQMMAALLLEMKKGV